MSLYYLNFILIKNFPHINKSNSKNDFCRTKNVRVKGIN